MAETAEVDLNVRVDVLDLTPRPANVLADLRIRSIRQLLGMPRAELLRAPRFGSRSWAEVERKISEYVAGAWPPQLACQDGRSKTFGRKALVESMLSILPERERSILAARFGLWDGKIQTLSNIGTRLGVSRERVRQIEVRELRRLQKVFGSFQGKNRFGKQFEAFGGQMSRRRYALMEKDGRMAARAVDCVSQEDFLAVRFLQKVLWEERQNRRLRLSGRSREPYRKIRRGRGISNEIRTIH